MADSDKNVRIKVDLDDNRFSTGMKNMKKRFDDSYQSTKLLNKDFKELKKVIDENTAGFQSLGLFAAGAIAGIAAAAPSLSGTMARFKVEGMEFANTMGEALKPALDGLVNALGGVNSFLEAHPFMSTVIADSLLAAVAIGSITSAVKFAIPLVSNLATGFGALDAALTAIGAGGAIEVLLGLAAIAGTTYGLVKGASNIGQNLVNQFSPANGVTPPESQGYKFAPGTRSIYDDEQLGGSLKNRGLPSQSPERIYDPNTGEYRLKTQGDKTNDIIANGAKNMHLNLNLTIQNDGTSQQRMQKQFLVNPSFS